MARKVIRPNNQEFNYPAQNQAAPFVPSHRVTANGYSLDPSGDGLIINEFLRNPADADPLTNYLINTGNGTPGSPVEFSITPPTNVVYHIARLLIYGRGTNILLTNMLGGATLTNGLLLGVYVATTRVYDLLDGVVLQTTEDIFKHLPVQTSPALTSGSNDFIQLNARPYLEAGNGLILDGSFSAGPQRFALLVQDNLPANGGPESLTIKVQGWGEYIEGAP